MPVNYAIPPWLGQPADPAAHYATGLQIGVRIGQENAAQAYQQQQLARQQAQDAFEREYQTAKLNLDVDKIRRQQTAMATFQQLRAQGVSPEDALMQVGPDLGESINETLRTISMGKERQATMAFRQQQLAETQAYHQDIAAEREAATAERERAAKAREEETARFHRETSESREAQNRMRAEKAMETDAVLNQLNQELFDANTAIESEQNSWFGPNETKLGAAQKTATDVALAVEARKTQLLNQFGVKSTGGSEEAAPKSREEIPAQPTSPAVQAQPIQPQPAPTSPQQNKRLYWQPGKGLVPADYEPSTLKVTLQSAMSAIDDAAKMLKQKQPLVASITPKQDFNLNKFNPLGQNMPEVIGKLVGTNDWLKSVMDLIPSAAPDEE